MKFLERIFSHFLSPSVSRECSFNIATFAHDGTERRIVRPQDPAEQTECYSGKKKDHTVKNVLLVNAPLTILFLTACLKSGLCGKIGPLDT